MKFILPSNILTNLNKALWVFLIAIIIIFNVFRFISLEESPPGFHVDEISSAVTIQCLVTQGIDAKGMHKFPILFGDVHFGTPKPPTYIYPAILWTKIFGFSIASFRGFIAFVVLLTIIGLFLLAQVLMGKVFGLWVVLLASISPWGWMFSRIAFESMMGPMFMVWGLFVFFKSDKPWTAIISGALFTASMYSYPPLRMHIPLLLMTLFIYRCLLRKPSWLYFSILAVVMSALLSPLIYMLVTQDFMVYRYNQVSITSKEYLESLRLAPTLKNIAAIFFSNYFQHFNPEFLFTKGSENPMHSTRIVGILSWPESIAAVGGLLWIFILILVGKGKELIKSQDLKILLLIVVNIFIAIVPCALTRDGIPHVLRIVSAWPFVCLITAYVLWKATQRLWFVLPIICIITSLFTYRFLTFYYTQYPNLTWGMYSPWSKDMAKKMETQKDILEFTAQHHRQDFHAVYYLMNYKDYSCLDARQLWDKVREIVQ